AVQSSKPSRFAHTAAITASRPLGQTKLQPVDRALPRPAIPADWITLDYFVEAGLDPGRDQPQSGGDPMMRKRNEHV
ncbi:MAG: hypothetical protein RL291_523, partial [Pseudomonadota bacterium]